jgi:hypothetical protein
LHAFDSIYSDIPKTEAVVPRNAFAPSLVAASVTLDPIIRTVVATVTGEMRTEELAVLMVVLTTIARTVAAEKDVATFEVVVMVDEVAGTIGIPEVVVEEGMPEAGMAVADEDKDIVVEGEDAIDESSVNKVMIHHYRDYRWTILNCLLACSF